MRFLIGVVAIGLVARIAVAQVVNDSSLQVEQIFTGGDLTTGIAFLPDGDAFVIEKNSGMVRRLHDGTLGAQPVLDLNVANTGEQGLLGIALHPKFDQNGFAYLYHTEASEDGGRAIGNRIDRFHWDGTSLSFDRRITSIPRSTLSSHNGGKIIFGPDNKLYSITGDLRRKDLTVNRETSRKLTRSGVILRLNENGSAPRDNPFYNKRNVGHQAVLNEIYAYGIRNSFGIGFDPVSGFLWQTENGVHDYDEINRFKGGSNSGWNDLTGPRSRRGTMGKFVKLGKRARYVDPQLSWLAVVAPTDVEFYSGDGMGEEYENDMFIADFHGTIYRFRLTDDRKYIALEGELLDRVIDVPAEADPLRIGSGFGIVTDLASRPDGLYVLSMNGSLHRISVADSGGLTSNQVSALPVPEPASILLILTATALLGRRRR